ncbi:iron complex transport system substrate-binding protein [Nocardioides zeae]|uniref:Iron complex transport system substrate-binding protein n=1 Tax=Nocardioides zeae TaxID=1457234 RepID=A0ACC6IFI6_9ACTN|nr:ABC transporter substrate-binding protein [Nocardioides zeae]MDR6176421.1 iron complex transport system substrate-binding protein [Nocardioides zeae]MDR6209434.1 iron complex transport system substrate-binding protein [Nocardioides zeae]
MSHPPSATVRRTATTAAAVLLLAPLAACGTEGDDVAISVENCGDTVELDGAPERVVMLKSAAAVTLHRLDVLDRVVARAGVYPAEYYDADTLAAIEDVPLLTDRTDTSGHLQISREEVVAQTPDLVLGQTDTVTRDTLASNDVALVEEPAFCGSLDGDATFDDVYDQVRLYGEVFERADEADAYVAELEERVAAIEARVPADEDRSVAVLYPTVGGGVTYAYGRGSMSAPLVEAAGLENVFGDVADRVFEVSAEEIVARDPDVVILLRSDGDPAEVTEALTSLPGADALRAVQTDAVLPLLLNHAEPPTPLAVDGLERVVDFLEQTR